MSRVKVSTGLERWARCAAFAAVLLSAIYGSGVVIHRGGDFLLQRRLVGSWQTITPPQVSLVLGNEGKFEQHPGNAESSVKGHWRIENGALVLDDDRHPLHLSIRFDPRVDGVFIAEERYVHPR